MKILKIFLIFLTVINFSFAESKIKFNIDGNLNYQNDFNSEKLENKISTNFVLNLLENKSIKAYITGSVENNYDIFQNIYQVNAFTQINIEF